MFKRIIKSIFGEEDWIYLKKSYDTIFEGVKIKKYYIEYRYSPSRNKFQRLEGHTGEWVLLDEEEIKVIKEIYKEELNEE